MANRVTLRLVNNATSFEVEMGASLMNILHSVEIEQPYPVLGARVNNCYKELSYRIYKPVTVEFFDIRHFEGYRIYQRTLSFVMQMASVELFPERKLRIRHTLGNGFYAEFDDKGGVLAEDAVLLKLRMEDIVARNLPITRTTALAEDVA